MVAALVALLLAACSGNGHKSAAPTGQTLAPGNHGRGPWDICGQSINLTSSGFHVEDASQHDLTVGATSGPDAVYLQLSHDCNADVHYQVEPSNAASVLASAPATRPVVVVLHPVARTFAVTFQRPSGPGKVTVDLTQPTTSLGK